MTWPEDACIARDIDIGALRMMYRRSFIGLIAGAVVVGATRGSNARSDRIGDIGVQLYTVRHEIQRDFERTLARIAEIGYREVEFIELFGRAPRAARAMLDCHGLVAPSSRLHPTSVMTRSAIDGRKYWIMRRSWARDSSCVPGSTRSSVASRMFGSMRRRGSTGQGRPARNSESSSCITIMISSSRRSTAGSLTTFSSP